MYFLRLLAESKQIINWENFVFPHYLPSAIKVRLSNVDRHQPRSHEQSRVYARVFQRKWTNGMQIYKKKFIIGVQSCHFGGWATSILPEGWRIKSSIAKRQENMGFWAKWERKSEKICLSPAFLLSSGPHKIGWYSPTLVRDSSITRFTYSNATLLKHPHKNTQKSFIIYLPSSYPSEVNMLPPSYLK
jgi:hypothetical protein